MKQQPRKYGDRTGSGEPARRLGLVSGAIATVGIVTSLPYPTPSEAQQPPPGTLVGTSQSQDSAQSSMADSIRTFCPRISATALPGRTPETANLSTICTGMVGNATANGYRLSQEELNAATQTLNGEEIQAMQQQVGDVRAAQVGNITARMEQIRAGLVLPGLSIAGLTLDDAQILTAGFEDDAMTGEGDMLVGEDGSLSTPIWDRLGVFLTGGLSVGDKSRSGEVTGYDFYALGLTAGADYRVRDDVAVGGAVGYSYYNADFDNDQNNPSGQDLDTNSVIFSFFGTYFPSRESLIPLEGLFLDGVASFGWSFFDMSRRLLVPNQSATNPNLPFVNETAEGDTTAFQYGFAANLGYEFNVRQFTITPVGRVWYTKAEIDGFEESGASPLNLEVDDQDATSLTAHAGLSVGYAFSTPYGVIEPTVRGEYVHEFENDENGATIQYVSDPTGSSAFNIITENPNKNYGIVGAALTGTLPGGWSGFADFETVVEFGEFDIYTFRLGARREF